MWRAYGTDLPEHMASPDKLEFGKGYWIKATEPSTLYLKGASEVTAASVNNLPPLPPATYYGPVQAADSFVPEEGMSVQAFVNGVLCGRDQTQKHDEQIVYAVHVSAGEGDSCGASGRSVSIKIGGTQMGTVAWNNEQPELKSLVPDSFVVDNNSVNLYLPLMLKVD